jgi:hypothetical protein
LLLFTVITVFFMATCQQPATASPYPDPINLQLPLGTDSLATDELWFSTYFGGIGEEHPYGLALDPDGNIVIAGITYTDDLPNATGFQTTFQGGGRDGFVAKLSPDGGTALWATYLGGSDDDHVTDVAVDGDGAIYVLGRTLSDDFPTTPGAYDRTRGGGELGDDGFVTKLRPDGSGLVYSTFLHGSNDDRPASLVVDPVGRVYVCGQTVSLDFPTTAGCYQNVSQRGNGDGFISILSADGGSLEASTYLGDIQWDTCHDIALGDDGRVYVAGTTTSWGFPVTAGVFQDEHGSGRRDAFCARLDGNLTTLERSSFLGGSGDFEEAFALDVDEEGGVFVSGVTDSGDFPVTGGAFQAISGSGRDGFIARISPNWASLSWSSYIGGDSHDRVLDLVVDGVGYVHFCGATESSDLNVTDGAFDSDLAGSVEGFVARVTANGSSLEYCSYLGGTREDIAEDLVPVDGGNILVAGMSGSNDFPTTERAFDRGNAGRDAFVCLMRTDEAMPVAVAGEGGTVFEGETVEINGSASTDDLGILYYIWQYEDGSDTYYEPFQATAFEHTFTGLGWCSFTLTVVDGAGNTGTDTIGFQMVGNALPRADAGEDMIVDQGATIEFDGSNSTDDAGIANWTWTFEYGGENVSLEGAFGNFTFDIPGEYVVTLNVTDVLGKSATDHISVTVLDTEPPVAVPPDDIDMVIGWVDFNGSRCHDNVGVKFYSWRFPYRDYVEVLEREVTGFYFEFEGHRRVNLTVWDAAGNSDTAFFNVTVRDVNPPEFLHPEWETLYLESKERTLRFNITLWRDDNALFDLNNNLTWDLEANYVHYVDHGNYGEVRVPGSGRYNATFTAVDRSGNVGSHSFLLVFEWKPVGVVPPSVDAGKDKEVLVGEEVTLTGSYEAGLFEVVRLVWYVPADPPFDHEGAEVVFTPRAIGVYDCVFQAYDSRGNVGEDTVRIVAQPGSPGIAVLEGLNETLSGTVYVLGKAWSDALILVIEYRIDTGEWQNATGTKTWMVAIDTTQLSDGEHVFHARVWDGSAHAETGPIDFVVQNEVEDDDDGDDDGGIPLYIIVVILVVCVAVILVGVVWARRR